MDGRTILSQLLKQKSVNDLSRSFTSLTRDINNQFVKNLESKKASASAEDAGAGELIELLNEMLDPLINEMSNKDLDEYLVRTHIVFTYWQAKLNQLQDEMDDDSNNLIKQQMRALGECHACVTATRNMLIDNIVKRRCGPSSDQKKSIKINNEILDSLEREYIDFFLVMTKSTDAHQKKVCSLPVGEVADRSRCITFTEMQPLSDLPKKINDFYPDKTARNNFKKKLCNHMIHNVTNIAEAHASKQDELTRNEITTVLTTIRNMILATKWTLGWLGGVPIRDNHGKLINTVPHGMSNILSIINSGLSDFVANSRILFETMKEVANSALESKDNPGTSFLGFGKRSNRTQEKYKGISEYSSSCLRKLGM